jgi:hypothetical protein
LVIGAAAIIFAPQEKPNMPNWLTFILEIVKLTLPALIVFFTAYHLLKKYLDHQEQMRLIDLRQDQRRATLPLRLQAYERLSLFCERITLPNLLLRVQQGQRSASELRLALLLAIQQEYEHNITQQVYVSEQLWQIIKIARDDSIDSISIVAEKIDSRADSQEFAVAILEFLNQREATALEKALIAIKKEASLLFQ